MAASKLIFVTGGTGKQGGAVARNLVKNGFDVKVLTRNPESPNAKALQDLGVRLVKGNLDDVESFRQHLRDVYGIFSVQTFEKGVKKEIEQGKKLADLAEQFGVRHFIYSSVAGADRGTGIPHFESKNIIEKYIKELDLPYTILRPASLYENFLMPQVKEGILKGKFVQPVNREVVMPYLSSEDVGKAALKAFQNPEFYLNKTLTLASETLSTQEVVDLFAAELNMPMQYKKLPWFISRIFLGKTVYQMFEYLNQGNLLAQPEEISGKNDFPEMQDFRTWINLNFKNNEAQA